MQSFSSALKAWWISEAAPFWRRQLIPIIIVITFKTVTELLCMAWILVS